MEGLVKKNEDMERCIEDSHLCSAQFVDSEYFLTDSIENLCFETGDFYAWNDG